ncbi:MAG TPA: cupin domain-containing protein [Thermoplasmata archaeon]|nr:cupin domain-containing protein [Thermoplasmata archaeon]
MPAEPIANLEQVRPAGETRGAVYREVLRRTSMSIGVYVIPKGAADPQSPHDEDEAYIVLRGRARFHCGSSASWVAPGDLLYVPARESHHFDEVGEEMVLAVFFAPPEGSGRSDGPTVRPRTRSE